MLRKPIVSRKIMFIIMRVDFIICNVDRKEQRSNRRDESKSEIDDVPDVFELSNSKNVDNRMSDREK